MSREMNAKGGTPVLTTGVKMLSVIDAIARSDQALTVSELAEIMGWSRATAHQYLQTAVAAGWAFQDKNARYALSFHVAEIGSKVNPAEEFRPVLLPIMQDVVDELGAPVSFAVLEQATPIIVERLEPMRAMFIRKGFEARVSLKSSASGRILLAFSTPEERRALARAEEKLDEQTYAEIREQGYSIVHSQWLGDLITAAAAPIFNRGVCVGVLSVIAERDTHSDETLVRSMLDASDRVNRELEVG